MIDWTGTYIITYNIILGMKKGSTWVARQVWLTSQKGGGGLQPPLPSPRIRLWSLRMYWTKRGENMKIKGVNSDIKWIKGFRWHFIELFVVQKVIRIWNFLGKKSRKVKPVSKLLTCFLFRLFFLSFRSDSKSSHFLTPETLRQGFLSQLAA